MSEADLKSERPGSDWITSSLPTFEPHLTVQQIAKMWNLSPDAIRSLFRGEPGVVQIKKDRNGPRRRRYISLRIPQSVAERVHRRLPFSCNVPLANMATLCSGSFAAIRSIAPVDRTDRAKASTPIVCDDLFVRAK